MSFNPFKLRKQLKEMEKMLAKCFKHKNELAEENKKLKANRQAIKPVLREQVVKDKLYYVATIGGYYSIKGNKLLKDNCSEVTKTSLNKGFIFDTEEKAKQVYERIMSIRG